MFLVFTSATYAQSLRVEIVSNDNNNSFCEGIPELFTLTANVNGGKEPYSYEWTSSWNSDTVNVSFMSIKPDTSGEIKLKVTDSSHPAKSKETTFQITEVFMSVDFNFTPDSICAQSPIHFNSTVSGGTPDYTYFWNFQDGRSSSEIYPVHKFISSGCSGISRFDTYLRVTDKNGCISDITKTVHVKKKPYLDFRDTENPYSPFKNCHTPGDTVKFDVVLENHSQDISCITSYDIDWGDGNGEAGVSFPLRHTYTTEGAFELKITAANSSGCDLVWSKFVYNQSSPAGGVESLGGTEGCGPIEYSFVLSGYENNSVGTTYTWNFGDGTPAVVWDYNEPFNNDSITHLYESSSCRNEWGWLVGDFNTIVTVNNGCGEMRGSVNGVKVWDKPEADVDDGDLTIDSICTGESVQLINNTIPGHYGSGCSTVSTYLWDFGNGVTSNLDSVPPMVWSEPGNYDIVLDVSNPCGVSKDTFKIVVMEPPIANATVDTTAGCTPFTPKFKNSSTGEAIGYLWQIEPSSGFTFVNGTSSSSIEPDIRFNKIGFYQVVLYAFNVCDQMDSVILSINVFTKPSGRIEGLSDICITDPIIHPSVNYKDNGSAVSAFNWTFTGGTPSSSSTETPGEIAYVLSGNYIVNLSMENACGVSNLKDSVSIYDAPEVSVTTPVTICESNDLYITGTTVSNETSFVWQPLGDGYFNNDTLKNPTYYPGAGDIQNSGTTLRIIAKGESPCDADTAIVNLIIQKLPIVQVDENAFICKGNAYVLNSTTAENFDIIRWYSSGDGYFSDSTILLPTYYPGSGDLSLGHVDISLTAQAISPCLLSASDTLVINYADNPTINAGSDQDICQDGQTELNAVGTGLESVVWHIETSKGGFSDPTSLNPLFTLNPGYSGSMVELSIKAIGGYGCNPVYDTLKLSVIPYPVVFAGNDSSVCESGIYELTGAYLQEYSDFYWILNGDGFLNDSSLLNPVYTPGLSDIAKGMATLTLIAEGNSVCADISDEVIINIQELPQSFAGDDQDVCKVNNFITAGQQNNGASIHWASLGTGSFENDTKLITTYYPSENDKDIGSVDLVLTVNATAPCLSFNEDTVTLTFIDPPEVFAGNDTTICSSSFIPNEASVLNSTQYVWSSNGSGTWYDENTLAPTYFPSASDIITGSADLILTSTNPSCPAVSDTMKVGLTPFPISDAGTDDVICEDDVKRLDDSHIANFTSLAWRTNGDGYFNDSTILNPYYSPGNLDIDNGSVKLYLIVTGIPPCNSFEIDSITLSIQKSPVVYAGPDTIIGEGELFTTNSAEAWNVNYVNWSTLGDGTFINGSDIISTYKPGENDLLNNGVYLVLKGSYVSPCNKESIDTVFVTITPKPIADAGEDINICEGSNVSISTASAEEYSEIFWTTNGSGIIKNDSTLTPTYQPSAEDIEKRKVVLTLNARGKEPIEYFIDSDSMVIHIVHNAITSVLPLDTTCENSAYKINDIIYQDQNTLSWSSSGNGYFNGTTEENPIYNFSTNDREKDTIYFYVEVTSILPCLYVDHDTMMVRLYHEPKPLFDYDNPEGCAPLKVDFTNTSTGEDLSYFWDLGNGLESFNEDPGDIVYQQGRIADTTYTVTLEATNRCNSFSTSKDIIVKPIPIADFGMDVAWGCSPMEINFINVTTGLADSYVWKWGDDSDNSLEENPESHIFVTGDTNSTYTVSLIAENECGIDSIQKSVIIFPNNVTAFFETDTTFGCAPLEVSFTNYSRGVLGDEPFLNWSWNFGDGNSITETMNPVHVFENPGIYTVTLFVNDTCSHDYFTTDIHVMGAPQPDFITDKTEYCEHDTVFVNTVNMSIDEIASVTWDFGDSTQGYDFNYKHVYDTSGVFTITLTAENIHNGCAASTSKDISILEAPVAAFSVPDNDGCQSLQITFLNETVGGDYYSWDFGNGNKSIETNGKQLFTEAGTYDIILYTSDIEGCSDSISRKLVVNPKPLAFFEPSSLQTCFSPVDVEFKNLSEDADDYSWDFGNGLSSKDTDPVITYNDYGDYPIYLIATNMFNCSDTSEMEYHVYHNPVADFSVDTTIGCDPFIVPFNNLSEYGLEYNWSFGNQSLLHEEEPIYTFKGEGVYSVTLTVVGLGGCKDSITKENFITTNPSPISDFTYTRVNEIDTVQFNNNSSGAISYLWDFGDGHLSEETDPWHRYLNYGTYNVSLTAINEYNCRNIMSDSINFELFKGLFLPNAFSPENYSAKVRLFMAVGIGLTKYHLLIYDTWGNLLWETEKLEQGVPAEAWDGTFKGKPLPPDVYVWYLKEVIFKDGTTYNGKRYGTITLIK